MTESYWSWGERLEQVHWTHHTLHNNHRHIHLTVCACTCMEWKLLPTLSVCTSTCISSLHDHLLLQMNFKKLALSNTNYSGFAAWWLLWVCWLEYTLSNEVLTCLNSKLLLLLTARPWHVSPIWLNCCNYCHVVCAFCWVSAWRMSFRLPAVEMYRPCIMHVALCEPTNTTTTEW